MRKNTKKAVCILFAVLLLVCSFPISAFAVDPVSAAAISNAFAQAIAAYGASNGVSMTFDVASTAGIGETVHELWKDFRAGTQDADDYETLAAALFPNLYYKAEEVLAGGVTAAYVGYQITSEYAEEFDNFYNWLLSGPAEMVQVDNQYYQFSQAQIGTNSVSIPVVDLSSAPLLPIITSGGDNAATYNAAMPLFTYFDGDNTLLYKLYTSTSSADPYVYSFFTSSDSYLFVCCDVDHSPNTATNIQMYPSRNGYSTTTFSIGSTSNNTYRLKYNAKLLFGNFSVHVPIYATREDGFAAIRNGITNGFASDTVGVKAYDETGIADFPDTADPNYDAIHRAKNIPVDEPWDDTLYGDGTGTLTDAQKEAISGALDQAIADDGTLVLAGDDVIDNPGTDDSPSSDPDVYGVIGLENLFPFCIPFDIYNFLNALAATPTAPHFTATLQLPAALGGAQTIELDFDNPTFNQLAQLLRLLELLAFIVGLALLTRSMFIRG